MFAVRLIDWMVAFILHWVHWAYGTFLDLLADVEQSLRAQLEPFGMTDRMQTAALVFAFAMLLLLTIRVFGGVVRAVVGGFFLLMALQVLLPALRY